MPKSVLLKRIKGTVERWLSVDALGRGVRIGPKGWAEVVPPEIIPAVEADPTLASELEWSPVSEASGAASKASAKERTSHGR